MKPIEIYEPLIEKRLKSITTLYGVDKKTGKKHEYFGTGFYIKSANRVYIVTALHVAKLMEGKSYLVHSVNGKTFITMGSYVGCPIPGSDFAIVGCFHESLNSDDIAIDLDNVKPHYQNLRDHCLVNGCPDAQLFQIPVTSEITAKMNSLVTEIVGFSDDFLHVYLNYPNGMVDPPGMSGSPIWRIVYDKADNVMEDNLILSGILIRWDSKNEILIATNGQVFKKYITKMIREYDKLFPRTDLS